jgi:hypothetical protein
MQWIAIATPPFTSVETFDAVRAHFGQEPDGLQARWVGAVDGGLRVVMVWESKAHADRFFAETLGPALAAALGPEPAGAPTVIGFTAERAYLPGLTG